MPPSAQVPLTIVQRTRMQTLRRIRASPMASRIPKTLDAYLEAQRKHPIYNGWPGHLRGPPLTLYSPPLARLTDRLRPLDTPGAIYNEEFQYCPNEDLYFTHVHDLFAASKHWKYASAPKYTRRLTILPILKHLLGVDRFHWVGGEGEYSAVEHIPVDNASKVTYPLYIELDAALPCIPSSFAYRMDVAQDSYAFVRDISNCPAILVAIYGPYLVLYGAVFADVFIVQRLMASFIYLGEQGWRGTAEEVTRAALVFRAVREALKELREWYATLPLDDEGLKRSAGLPKIEATNPEAEAVLKQLTLTDRLMPIEPLDDEGQN